MHLPILWFCVYLPDGAIVQYKYLNRVYFDCKTKLFLDRQGNYIFTQEGFYPQGILNDINKQDTAFLDCKYNHMMKSGAPLDKIGVLYHLLPNRIPWFLWFLVLSQFFIDGVGPFKLRK